MAFEVKTEFEGCTPGQYAVVGPQGLDSCYASQSEAETQVADLNAAAGFSAPVQNAMGEYPWEGQIAFTDVDTGDGRILDGKTLGFASLPRPLAIQTSIAPGHDGGQIGGRIDSIDIGEDGIVWATGVFEDTDFGKLAAYRVGNQILKGISVDVRDGEAVPEGQASEDGFYDGPVRIVGGNIMGATVVMHPAFVDAQIRLKGDDRVPLVASAAFAQAIAALVASGTPIVRPAEWFTNPELQGPTLLQVDGDHIFGHMGTWGTCHVGIAGVCQPPPGPGVVDYTPFHQGQVETTNGPVRTGTYTFHANHASTARGMTAGKAADHYANSALGGADVVVGEDAFGLWVNGAIRPSLTPEQRVELLASKPSGDWRFLGGKQCFMGVLAVNQPGFPIPQTLVASAADGTIVRLQGAVGDLYADHEAMVASGACTCGGHGDMAVEEPETEVDAPVVLSVEDRIARLENLLLAALGDSIIETLSFRIGNQIPKPETKPHAVSARQILATVRAQD